MALDIYAFEILTGRRLIPLPITTGSWEIAVNADELIRCTIPSRALVTKQLAVWNDALAMRTGLLAVVDGTPVAAGPIKSRDYVQGASISLAAGGMRTYLDRRLCLPVAARSNALIDANGDPVAMYDTNLTGLSYGTIAKRYISQMLAWPGGNLPIDLPADELGDRVRNVAAIDLKKIRALIDALSQVQNGPDIAFRPRWAPDGLGIRWEMQHGSTAVPRLGRTDADAVTFNVGSPNGSGAFGLTISEDGSTLAEEVFAAGGRSVDRSLQARARLATLFDAGYPLLQAADTSHSDVVEQTTMQAYADQGAKLGQYSASTWSMKVRAAEKGTPMLGDYWLGDMARIIVDPAEPVIPARTGGYLRRISSIKGDEKNDSYSIGFAEAIA